MGVIDGICVSLNIPDVKTFENHCYVGAILFLFHNTLNAFFKARNFVDLRVNVVRKTVLTILVSGAITCSCMCTVSVKKQ